MRSSNRNGLITAALILVAGLAAFLAFTAWDRPPSPALSATITRDCAPWDGAAFTVYIPYDQLSAVTISIWRAPDIKFPITFSFPDQTGQVGFAYTVAQLGPLEPLAGHASFTRVEQGSPVRGEFHLSTEAGRQFQGEFTATWGDTLAMCG